MKKNNPPKVHFFRLTEQERTCPELTFLDRIYLELNRADEAIAELEAQERLILESPENIALQVLVKKKMELEQQNKESFEKFKPFFKNKEGIPSEFQEEYKAYLHRNEKELPPIRFQIREIQNKNQVSKRLNAVREPLYLAEKEVSFLEFYLEKYAA